MCYICKLLLAFRSSRLEPYIDPSRATGCFQEPDMPLIGLSVPDMRAGAAASRNVRMEPSIKFLKWSALRQLHIYASIK